MGIARVTGTIGAVALATGCAAVTGPSAGGTSSVDEIIRSPGAVDCVVTDKLIPTCGAWWGIAPEMFTGRPPTRAVALAERRMGRRADIVHVYHRDGERFPTVEERAVAKGPRLLLITWTPSTRHSWAEVARGAVDRRIDALAAHINQSYPGRFFLSVYQEPEDEVRKTGGYSAEDYVAMYRHVIGRLRDKGVRNAVTVMTYTGMPSWAAKPWFERLYPGDDVVDWIGLDPYADGAARDFAELIDRRERPFPGFYRWIQSRFPGKPIMLTEWGAPGTPKFKSRFYNSVNRQIIGYPQVKALVYFDSALASRGDARFDTRFDTAPAATRAFAALARAAHFTGTQVPAG